MLADPCEVWVGSECAIINIDCMTYLADRMKGGCDEDLGTKGGSRRTAWSRARSWRHHRKAGRGETNDGQSGRKSGREIWSEAERSWSYERSWQGRRETSHHW